MRLFLSICLSIFSLSVFAQNNVDIETESYNSRLKVSPIQFGQSYFEISYERFINEGKHSLQFSPMIMLKRNSSEEFKGIQFEMQYRIYLKKLEKGIQGTWIFSNIDLYSGLYANGLSYNEESIWGYNYDPVTMEEIMYEREADIIAAEGGLFVGLELIISKRIVLDFTVGGGVRYSEVDEIFTNNPSNTTSYYDVFDLGYYGVKPKLNLQIGITL